VIIKPPERTTHSGASPQLQQPLEEFRGGQPARAKLPESAWQAALELPREHGVFSVAHALRLDDIGLKRRLGGLARPP
jgi:hypothetical protein